VPQEILDNKDIKVITLPKFKVKELDTVFILPKHYEHLTFEWGGRVFCNKKETKTRIIIKTFEDESSQVLLPEGFLLTRDYNNNDNIIFTQKNFSPTERFIILKVGEFERKKEGGLYTIRTADDVPVKVIEKGERLRATFKQKVDTFQINVEKKKDE